MPAELVQRLAKVCEDNGLDRFSPAEMVALLEDGEEVAWIVEQMVADPAAEAAAELTRLLEEVAGGVAPPGAVETPGVGGIPVAAIPDGDGPAPAAGVATGLPAALDEAAGLGMDLPPGLDLAQIQQVLASPRGALLADFSAFCQERGFAPTQAATEGAEEQVRRLHDEWRETPREAFDGRRPAEVMEGGRLIPAKVATFRREAPKVGRNDPCPCGSSRKYKKCCGRGG